MIRKKISENQRDLREIPFYSPLLVFDVVDAIVLLLLEFSPTTITFDGEISERHNKFVGENTNQATTKGAEYK